LIGKYLISTISGKKYPFERLEEFAENGESLEVWIELIKSLLANALIAAIYSPMIFGGKFYCINRLIAKLIF